MLLYFIPTKKKLPRGDISECSFWRNAESTNDDGGELSPCDKSLLSTSINITSYFLSVPTKFITVSRNSVNINCNA